MVENVRSEENMFLCANTVFQKFSDLKQKQMDLAELLCRCQPLIQVAPGDKQAFSTKLVFFFFFGFEAIHKRGDTLKKKKKKERPNSTFL